MTSTLNETIVTALALPLIVAIAQASHSSYRRLRSFATARCVGHIANMLTSTEEPSDEEMQALQLRFPRSVILNSIEFVAEKVYGDALYRLALIVEVCRIDYYLIGRIERTKGLSRIGLMAKLSSLTHATSIEDCSKHYMEEGDCRTRFYAMTALVSARPDRAIRHIANFEAPLSLCEVAHLTRLLRRTGAPIAYTPLLASQNRNLQMVGIYLCGHFSIVEAEPHLRRLAESADGELSYMALQTLCSLRGDISSSQTSYALQRLAPHQRLSFIRHAVLNCYSLRSCAHLLTREERTLFAQHINSYKCQIVCN